MCQFACQGGIHLSMSHGLDFLGPFHFCLKGDYQTPKQMFAVQFVAQ